MKDDPQTSARRTKISREDNFCWNKTVFCQMYVLLLGLNPNFVENKRMKKLLTFLLMPLFMACQNQTENTGIVIEKIQEKGPVAKVSAKFSIKGMTCAHGCGGKIQKELEKIPGVTATQLDFVEEREVNVVTADFNTNATSIDKMIECVNTIADGKYKVVAAQEITTTLQ